MAEVCTQSVDTGFAALGYAKVSLLGVLQGITELLPISSTAHMRVVPALLGCHAACGVGRGGVLFLERREGLDGQLVARRTAPEARRPLLPPVHLDYPGHRPNRPCRL